MTREWSIRHFARWNDWHCTDLRRIPLLNCLPFQQKKLFQLFLPPFTRRIILQPICSFRHASATFINMQTSWDTLQRLVKRRYDLSLTNYRILSASEEKNLSLVRLSVEQLSNKRNHSCCYSSTITERTGILVVSNNHHSRQALPSGHAQFTVERKHPMDNG